MRQEEKPLWKRIVLVILIVFGVAMVIQSAYSVYLLWQRRDIVFVREKELDRLEREQEELKKKLSDAYKPDFIEKEARNKLGLIKDGETLIYTPPEMVDSSPSAQVQNSQSADTRSPWQQWMELLF